MLLVHGRRRTTEATTTTTTTTGEDEFPLPPAWASDSVPTPPGSGIIHPSVVDMGEKWNGYRWWRADTPYPEQYENPSIYASNTRITWDEPPGISNPIDPWPGEATADHNWFNSDTELVWDAANERFVLYWREVKTSVHTKWFVATSTNGVTWTHHGEVVGLAGMSNTIAYDPVMGKWRMWAFAVPGFQYTADDLLGPWTLGPVLVGWLDPDGVNPYHGDVILYEGVWIAIWSANVPEVWGAASTDGTTWYVTPEPIAGGYRPTLCASTEAGYIDMWISQVPNYARLHESLWLDLLP